MGDKKGWFDFSPTKLTKLLMHCDNIRYGNLKKDNRAFNKKECICYIFKIILIIKQEDARWKINITNLEIIYKEVSLGLFIYCRLIFYVFVF